MLWTVGLLFNQFAKRGANKKFHCRAQPQMDVYKT